MDVVACSSFVGQDIAYIDSERFAHATARGLCIYDAVKGPREMIWRHEQGLLCFAADVDSSLLVFSGQTSEQLEMVKVTEAGNGPSTPLPNPCKCAFINLAISSEAQKLYGLSGMVDHRLVIWSLDKAPKVLVAHKLDVICRKVAVNPVDANLACVYGADGLRLLTLYDVFGQMSLQVDQVREAALDGQTPATGDDINVGERFTTDIAFCTWLPHNRILVVFSSGDVYEVSVDSKLGRPLGRFMDPVIKGPKHEVALQATCAVLTISHLIIGTVDGFVCWFPLDKLLQQSPAVGEGSYFKCPAQILKVHALISSLVVDPNRAQLIIGTSDGQIFKAPVDVESPPEAEKGNDQDKDETASADLQAKLEYKKIRAENIGNDVSGGIILCSKFATMGVKKITSKAKASLTFLMMGSHDGVLNIWRHTAASVDSGIGGTGIRRSAPRMMKEILSLRTKSESLAESDRAVCAIDVVPWKSHTLFVYLGLTSGQIEVWKIEATENDEDDVKDGAEHESKLVEDDEGSCVVRLESSFQLKSKVFNSAISNFAVLQFGGIDAETRVVVSSSDDQLMYVFSAIRDNQLALGQVLSVLDLKQSVPMCLTVAEDCMAAFSSDGTICCYPADASSLITSHAVSFQSCGQIQLVATSSVARIAVAVNVSGWAWYLQLDAPKPVSRASFSGVKPLEHPDLVSTLAFSPNGEVFVTGCINGIVTLWKIDLETLDVYQTNQVALHSTVITCMAFSPNSTSLFTSSVDGSSFILAVGKLVAKPTAKQAAQGLQVTTPAKPENVQYTVSDSTTEHSAMLTLREFMQAEQDKELKAAHKFKCMGISAAVQEIHHRLSILIKQNAERSELEQLSLEDFVVDLEKKQSLELKNKDNVTQLRGKYALRQRWLELLAARLKNLTWDAASESSVPLKPFTGMVEVDAIESEGVSSFPITRLTSKEEMMLTRLKRLRALEVRCMKRGSEPGNIRHIRGSAFFRCAWYLSLKGCMPDVSWIVNDGQCWPLQRSFEESNSVVGAVPSNGAAASGSGNAKGEVDPSSGANRDTAMEDDEDASVLSHEDYYDINETELLNLIYAPETVRTIVQKRNQILFLKEIVRKIMERFNEVFAQLQREKDDAIQFITTRNDRIAAVLEELHQSDKVWAPSWTNVERRGSAIEVSPHEMVAEPYESEEVRLTRLREAEEKALKQQSDEQQLERERALVDMMHGTLEIKRDVFAEALLLQRPPWMDTLTPAEMSDAQLKEYEIYQNKLRELQEEQAHYRKTLEQEMKKLRVEITDCCKAFNDKVEALNKLKILANKEVFAQEIYIVRISCSMVKADHLRANCKRNDNRLQDLRKDRAEIKARNERINRNVEELKARIGAVQEEEKNMDKAFRRDLQNLCNNTFDQESLKIFTSLYRKRMYPRGGFSSSLDNYGDQSEIDVSASASHRFRRSVKDASSSRRQTGKNSSRRAGGDMNATKGAKNRMRSSRNVSSSAMGGGKDTTAANLGPMQQAAQALLNTEVDNTSAIKAKDPYFEAVVAKQKMKKVTEAQIPLLNPLSMELDCPEGFVVDQFSWSKLQELRNARIEKEIEAKLLSIDQAEVRSKMAMLELEENKLNAQVNDTRQARDSTVSQLHNTETNLDVMVTLLQGQDEVDRDAVATEYASALLFPVEVIAKYNARIKELGGEKISVLAKTKVFRRKINLISWEAKHQGLQAKHFEAYYTDLQLFRVTRDLQKVILEGESAYNQKVVEIVALLCRLLQ